MQQQILQLTLTADEQQLVFLRGDCNVYTLNVYDIENKTLETLYTTTSPITNFVLLQNCIVFLENTQLQQLMLHDGHMTTIGSAAMLAPFNEAAYTYEQDGNIYVYDVQAAHAQVIAINVQQQYPTNGAIIVYRKKDELFYWQDGEQEKLPNLVVESAALSFDGHYIAIFGEQHGLRHFYVYDIEQRILQNMTELLGDPIGYEGPALPQRVVEVPTWTETNAFYFSVTANEEVRLYYGDLYGTLLPASPEEQLVYAYTIAKSGNWAITATTTQQLQLLDITTGNEMEIFVVQ